ncbi:phosphorylase family protein [Aliirhizobium smilacinae]|uniref:Nucleoside phosphorylase domain-containing protein n=1 Tax=Aliirhizobium smilacinae TaxID=1395944 RepID=A0A5C4X972_9HYPH|nr:hypothetical protein [Rhizobium smilacinae]TNM59917.1 hypothetical protein FHP24_27500 [Rhizobium smilacinae]
MLKELNGSDWLKLLDIPPKMVPSALILRGTRNLSRHYMRYAAHFSEIFEVGSPTGFLEDVFIGRFKGHLIGYASVYGGSMASEIVHIFGEMGTKAVIQTGCCGALNRNLRLGDKIYAESAYSGEGVAQYYSDKVEFRENIIGVNSTEIFQDSIYSARVFTTAALMAEGREEVAEWHSRGFDAVDMETAAVFAVAETFNMRKGSLLFVSDLPYTDQGLLHVSEADGLLETADDEIVMLSLQIVERMLEISREETHLRSI